MPKTGPAYELEFRHQMMELMRAGRAPPEQAATHRARDFVKSRGLVRTGD